ncbi:hypothetical protein ACTQ3M_08140 [Oscillospiraceae bacterium LCP25S3_E10]|nr:hypothetical protein [Ruminococcus sp.]MDD6447886.1 hypothetical protein [Ruminococcus sp.]MDY2856861.1 hypothetical protein [Oscillospiraceae bacterium]
MVNKAGIVVYNLMVLQSTQALGYVPLYAEKTARTVGKCEIGLLNINIMIIMKR